MKNGLLLLVLCFSMAHAWCQSFRVTGTVKDEGGAPLVGATVMVKKTGASTLTDTAGRYTLFVPDDKSALVVTFSGYERVDDIIGRRTTWDVVLRVQASSLNDVVVVGYGTQKKADLTGAVAAVTGADMNKRVATDPTQLLQGKLPGLSLTQGTGEAGNEAFVLRVRGLGTNSSAGSDPLVIVDGLPGSLGALDPQNIESVTLLKDAASAAIYGTRAANGVLLVTTKQGTAGKLQLSLDYSVGITRATALPKNLVYNSAEYMVLWDTAANHSGYPNEFTQAQIDNYTSPTRNKKLYPDYNWLDALMRTVSVQNVHLGITGGRNGTTYNVGLGYVDQPDIMIGFSYKKYNLQFNLNSRVNSYITFGSSLTLNYGQRFYASRGSQDQFLSDLSQSPMYGPILPDGSGRYTNSVYPSVQTPNKNPVAIAQNALVNNRDYYMQTNMYVNVRLLNGLDWRTSGGFNFDFNKIYDFKPVINQYNWFAGPTDPPERTLDVNGQGLIVTENNSFYPVGYTQLTYTRSFGAHDLKLLGGTQAEYNQSQSLVGSRNTPFANNITQELNAGPAGSQLASGTSSQWALRSFYGRLNYDYKEKYLLEANARYDASSRFPPSNRWGLFPSISGGWVVTKDFLSDVHWLTQWKVRGSWGKLGNQNISNYPYQDVYTSANAYNTGTYYAYSFSGTTLNSGVADNALTDPKIKWETTRIVDFGTDVTLFNRLNVTVDGYNKLTYDILFQPAIPAYIGLTAPTINNGRMRNTGVEISAQYTGKAGQVNFSVGGQLQANKNTLVKFGAPQITANNTINEEGKPFGSFYMYEFAGIFQSVKDVQNSPVQQYTPQPGYMKFKDVDGNDTVNANDRVIVPGVFPKFEYSFNASAAWKNFDLSMFFYGSYGQKQYVSGWGLQPFDQGSPPPSDWKNAWTPANHSTTMPLIYILGQGNASSNINTPSTYYLKDASFFRIKSVQLGYTLPAFLARHVAMNALRVYFTGDNLYTFTKFPGLDPERAVESGNVRFVVHPQNQVFTFGVKATF
ncbi:SusC/RagA family TonB-linked outer membrane protein [Dinghuibacter silviterrae]|uniref:TonB-linked SusC/RagA family outer membrane protein n=1 Tax=Dinghuibacter silviterrae TaxID=1539049 RepID=A0A4R8DYQ3_9BACT|nr:TonB-dependent receptor [Dinghuibacter silviterrae]TDX02341.1 TonB-linked SusC/RagA family outer membrane protein [Dinghuibacter silviterrae]